jgi:hypothetical protein
MPLLAPVNTMVLACMASLLVSSAAMKSPLSVAQCPGAFTLAGNGERL